MTGTHFADPSGSSGCCPSWVVQLFGKFQLSTAEVSFETLPGRRTTELLGYLLVFRQRPHHREVLATALWPESSAAQSRKYLRQGLWHLRNLGATGSEGALIRMQPNWVQASPDVWIDVAQLEEGFRAVQSVAAEQIGPEEARRLRRLVPLYRGDLLEGCYHDWCINERERLKAVYIAVLEKLLGYCETHDEFEEGLEYGERLLHNEPAHERAHWRLMRLRYLAGDRTGALRQFERCREALRDELGVAPGKRIMTLYEWIRADTGLDPPGVRVTTPSTSVAVLKGVDSGRGAPHLTGLDRTTLRPAAHLHEALRALWLAERLVEQSLHADRSQDLS